MEAHEIKRKLQEMFDAFGSHYDNPEKILEHMAEDGTWWVAGTTPASGTFTRAIFAAALSRIAGMTDKPPSITAKSWTIEGNRAVVEAEGYMALKDGRIYNNHYCYIFEFKDGKIFRAREYMDTQHVMDVYCR